MSAKKRWLRTVAVAAVLALLVTGVAAQDLFLTGGKIVDPRREEIRAQNVLVRGGVIVGFPEAPPADFTGKVLDVSGKWVIPALHDLHTHSYGNGGPVGPEVFLTPGTAKRMLYCGVAGFLDLFNIEGIILAMRDMQRADPSAVPGADIFAAGPCLTATDGHCSEYGIRTRLIDTPEAARSEIAELAQKRPDVVKIVYHTGGRMPTIDVPTLRAAIAAATSAGIKTVVHIGSWADAREATLAGASAITHVPRGELPDDLVALMKERGTTSIPTLAVHLDPGRFLGEGAKASFDSALLRGVVGETLLEAFRKTQPDERLARRLEREEGTRAERYASVRKLAAAGVSVLTGTDAGNTGVFQGYSVHRELALLVAAGLTPWQALRGSTTAAGAFLGRSYGVDAGDEASLVVLEASPIENIVNTERIAQVVHHGQVVDRAALIAPPTP